MLASTMVGRGYWWHPQRDPSIASDRAVPPRVYPVVGRDPELALFQRVVARAAEGQPGVVLVSGDAGIGKSTLLSEAARRVGAQLYLGRGVHVGGDAIPLAPLVGLIRQVQRERDVGQLRVLESLSELAASGAGRAHHRCRGS
jgi:hypothetical protein